jgi:Prolyl oligopeptidase, N-terminal beta-propeller domain
MFVANVTWDGDFVYLVVSQDTNPVNKVWLAKLDNKALPADGRRSVATLISGKLEWIKIKDDFDYGLYLIMSLGNVFYFRSNDHAPKRKVVRYDLDNPVSRRPIRLTLGLGVYNCHSGTKRRRDIVCVSCHRRLLGAALYAQYPKFFENIPHRLTRAA